MTDLVERLRADIRYMQAEIYNDATWKPTLANLREAVAEITRLRAENARAQERMRERAARVADDFDGGDLDPGTRDLAIARAIRSLKPEDGT